MTHPIYELLKSAENSCDHEVSICLYGVNVEVKCENIDFFNALKEYFLILSEGSCEKSTFDGFKLIYCHSNELFFRALHLSSQYHVTERVEFHPDNFYELIYSDNFGEILESRGGIRHLIWRSTSRQQYCIITPDYHHGVLEFQKPGIRFLREVIFRTHQVMQYFPLHASAAGTNSNGFIFVGESGAGKTTLAALVSAMANQGAFVSSDITLLKCQDSGVNAIGWPGGGISLGTETLDCLRRVAHVSCINNNFKHKDGYVRKGKHLLTPAEFSDFLNVRMATRICINAIIFPQINPEDESFSIEPLSPEEAFNRASNQLRNSISDTYRYGLVDILDKDMKFVNLLALNDLRAATKNIPAYSVYGHPVSIARYLVGDFAHSVDYEYI